MSKILLIAPPFYRLMGSHYNGLDLGLSYIAAFLKKHGHEAVIYNADFYNDSHYLDQRKLFANFDHYKATLNDDNHPIWREVGSAIKSFDPDIIGIQVYTGTYKNAQNVAFIAKAFNPEIKVIAGGTHPSLDPEGTLGCRAYDYACRGEGEYTMLEIASGKDPAGIKGLTYRGKNGRVINNEERPFITDLDALPFPERSGFFVGDGNIDTGAIITSRGCPFRCAYCASPKIWKRKVRYRGVGNVLDELEHMIKKDKVSLVRFQDDTFTLNKTRACAILEGMVSRGFKARWVCDTRVDRLDKEMLSVMRRSGCVRLKIGVESGSDKILRRIRKDITIEQVRRVVGLIKNEGISLTAYFMIGFPGETDEDVKKTISLAEEIRADYNSLSVVAPYYGTEIYQDLVRSGYDFSKAHWEYFYHQSKEMIINSDISKHLIDEFFNLNEKCKGRRI